MISDGDAVELFRKIPKESFELLLRNIKVREILEDLYERHKNGFELTYNERFDEIFDEIFRFFLRPLEIAVFGAKRIGYLFPLQDLVEIQSELLESYLEFLKALCNHIKLMWEISLGLTPQEDPVRKFVDLYTERLKSYRREFVKAGGGDEIFVLPKRVFERFENAIDSWNSFTDSFEKFRELVKETYVRGAKSFIEIANGKTFESYDDFANAFFNEEAKVFDELLVSHEYLETQKSMLENLMDYIYNFRMFFEEIAMSNPLNPFATISLLDKAFERIYDLRRKVRELEKRVEKLEKGG